MTRIKKNDLVIVASVITASLTALMLGLAYVNMLSQWMIGVTFGIIGMITAYFFKKSGKLSEYEYYLRLIEKMELPGKWDELVDEIIDQLLSKTEVSETIKEKAEERVKGLETEEKRKRSRRGKKRRDG